MYIYILYWTIITGTFVGSFPKMKNNYKISSLHMLDVGIYIIVVYYYTVMPKHTRAAAEFSRCILQSERLL